MKDWMIGVGENAVIVINAMGLVIIVIGTIEAFLRSVQAVFSGQRRASCFAMPICDMRAGWLPGSLSSWLRTSLELRSCQLGMKSDALAQSQ